MAPENTVVEEDQALVASYFQLPDEGLDVVRRMSPWLLRVELNRQVCLPHALIVYFPSLTHVHTFLNTQGADP